MLYKILVLLLGVSCGLVFFITNQYSLYLQSINEKNNIEKRISTIKQKEIIFENKKAKEKVLTEMKLKNSLEEIDRLNTLNNKKQEKNKLNASNPDFIFYIYDFGHLYKDIYKHIMNNKDIKKKVGLQEFENSFINKYLQALKKRSVITLVYNSEGKIVDKLNYIPIQIHCSEYKIEFCPKKIHKGYNELFMKEKRKGIENNLIFVDTNNIKLTDIQIEKFVKLNKNFFTFIKK